MSQASQAVKKCFIKNLKTDPNPRDLIQSKGLFIVYFLKLKKAKN